MKEIIVNNDRTVFTWISVADEKQPLANYSTIEVELRTASGILIRTLKTTNTVEEGKLYEYDTESLKFYIETRDTKNNSVIKAYLKARKVDSELSDGNFDINRLITTFNVKTE